MQSSISAWFSKLLSPTPQALRDWYGFQWQANQAVPATFQGFTFATAPAGIYVGFKPRALQADVPYFRGNGTQPLYQPPVAASAGLTQISSTILGLAPGEWGLNVDATFLRDLQGYLTYTNRCLNDLRLTAVGQALLDGLNNGGYAVFIDPAAGGGNAIQANNGNASLTWIATQLLSNANNLDGGTLSQLIVDTIAGNDFATRLTTLATTLNALPLYSLFLDETAYPANFLQQYLAFNGGVVDGTALRDWILGTDGGAFANLLAGQTLQTGVRVETYFLLAAIATLYAQSARGTGCGSSVFFNVRQDPNDQYDANTLRAPAIGLGHELVHALHNARGTQPGFQVQHVSTVLAELLCVGLGPFANEPISENAIRAQWNAIRNQTDPTNDLATARRTIYDDPAQSNATVLQLRAASRTV